MVKISETLVESTMDKSWSYFVVAIHRLSDRGQAVPPEMLYHDIVAASDEEGARLLAMEHYILHRKTLEENLGPRITPDERVRLQEGSRVFAGIVCQRIQSRATSLLVQCHPWGAVTTK